MADDEIELIERATEVLLQKAAALWLIAYPFQHDQNYSTMQNRFIHRAESVYLTTAGTDPF